MYKKLITVTIIFLMTMNLLSCQTADILTGETTPDKEWDLITDSASDTTVNIYLTHPDESMRAWLSSKFYNHMLSMYNVKLNVKILTFEDVVYTLQVDTLNEVKNGELDLLFIRDDEFRQLKELSYLYPEIAEKVPNLKANVNLLDMDVSTEHGYDLEGYAVPYGREQFVFMFDEDVLENYPLDTAELMTFVKNNPETFTYPNPMLDSVGAEFIRTVIFELIDEENMMKLYKSGMTIEEVKTIIDPALVYLKELDGYLLKEENQYMKSIDDVDYAFKEGMLYFSMSDDFAKVVDAIKEETYPDGAKSYIFTEGTITDAMYMVVPMNAANKTGAIVTMNEMLSVDMQVDKYTPSNWGNLPIVDTNLLAESDAEKFKKASVKRNTLRVEELAPARYYELPVDVIEMINQLWHEHVNQ